MRLATYLPLDAGQPLLLALHEVDMIELGQVAPLVAASVRAHDGDLPEAVCGATRSFGQVDVTGQGCRSAAGA